MTTAFAKAISIDTTESVRNVQASDFLEGEQILDCVRRHGWVTAARRSYLTDMEFATDRIQRLMGNRPQSTGPPPVPPDDPTGVHQLRGSRTFADQFCAAGRFLLHLLHPREVHVNHH